MVAHQLVPRLRPKYIALPERKYVFGSPEDVMISDGIPDVPNFRIEIRNTNDRKVVTTIQLLSPINKEGGREEYLGQRRQFLTSSANLLEIDLHHQGHRLPMGGPYPPGNYFVLLSRAQKRPWTEVWPIAIDQALPTVPVPLLKGDPDVPLNLQEAFARVYDEGGFDLAVDYRRPPDVELHAGESAWVNQHLRSAGFRK